MRGKGLLALVLIAAGTVGVWVATSNAPVGLEVGSDVVPIAPGEIGRISLEDGGVSWTIGREDSGGKWTANRQLEGSEALDWPVQTSRASAGVRVVGDALVAAPVSRSGARAFEQDRTLILNNLALYLPGSTIAGQAVVQRRYLNKTDVFMVEAQVAEMWRDEALTLWLDDRPVGCGLMPRPAEITIEQDDKTIKLRRNFNRWSLVEPVVAPADVEAAERLVGLLLAARGNASPDAEGPTETGLRVSLLDSDGAWSASFDESGSGVSRGVYKNSEYGPLVFVRTDLAVARELMEPGLLISRATAAMPAGDVAALVMEADGTSRRADRSVDGWSGELARLAPELLEALCSLAAERVLLEQPAGWQTLGTIELQRLGGLAGERVNIGVAGDRPVTEVGGVYRAYDPALLSVFRRAAGQR